MKTFILRHYESIKKILFFNQLQRNPDITKSVIYKQDRFKSNWSF
jgi:hypothetical protein